MISWIKAQAGEQPRPPQAQRHRWDLQDGSLLFDFLWLFGRFGQRKVEKEKLSEVTKAQLRILLLLQAELNKDLYLLMPLGVPEVPQILEAHGHPPAVQQGSDKEATEIRRSHAVQSCRGRWLHLDPDTWEVD